MIFRFGLRWRVADAINIAASVLDSLSSMLHFVDIQKMTEDCKVSQFNGKDSRVEAEVRVDSTPASQTQSSLGC